MKIKAAQNQHLIFTKHRCLNSQNKESGKMNPICPLLCSYINLLLDREETRALFPHLLLGREETLLALFPHLQVDRFSLLISIISRILSRYRHHETQVSDVTPGFGSGNFNLVLFALTKSLHESG